mgnify:CR=1 FL=1
MALLDYALADPGKYKEYTQREQKAEEQVILCSAVSDEQGHLGEQEGRHGVDGSLDHLKKNDQQVLVTIGQGRLEHPEEQVVLTLFLQCLVSRQAEGPPIAISCQVGLLSLFSKDDKDVRAEEPRGEPESDVGQPSGEKENRAYDSLSHAFDGRRNESDGFRVKIRMALEQ